MKIKKKHIFRFFGPFFSSFIIFGWDFVENEKNHQKSTVILPHFWLSKQKNYFWSHAKLAKMSSFQCTVEGVEFELPVLPSHTIPHLPPKMCQGVTVGNQFFVATLQYNHFRSKVTSSDREDCSHQTVTLFNTCSIEWDIKMPFN